MICPLSNTPCWPANANYAQLCAAVEVIAYSTCGTGQTAEHSQLLQLSHALPICASRP
jgi:hypothetical protein